MQAFDVRVPEAVQGANGFLTPSSADARRSGRPRRDDLTTTCSPGPENDEEGDAGKKDKKDKKGKKDEIASLEEPGRPPPGLGSRSANGRTQRTVTLV